MQSGQLRGPRHVVMLVLRPAVSYAQVNQRLLDAVHPGWLRSSNASVVAEFTGALPPACVPSFLSTLQGDSRAHGEALDLKNVFRKEIPPRDSGALWLFNFLTPLNLQLPQNAVENGIPPGANHL